jgi:raffinose/stachyose/melibiose transport system permease protein
MQKSKKIRKTTIGEYIFKIAAILILTVYTLGLITLLVWGFITSLKSRIDFAGFDNVVGLPSWEWSRNEIMFGNYKAVLDRFYVSKTQIFYVGDKLVKHQTRSNIWVMLYNTIIYTGLSTVLSTMCCFLLAYLCAKYDFKMSKVVYVYVLFVITIPTIGTGPAMITMLRTLGVYDTQWTHVLQKFNFSSMSFFIFYAFFERLSDAYTEAAEIDGASQLHILVNIIIPLSSKTIGTFMLLHFVDYWNDYGPSIMYTPTLPTISYGVYHLCNVGGNAEIKHTPALVAACMMLALPVLILFLILRDKLMGNVSIGGLKG